MKILITSFFAFLVSTSIQAEELTEASRGTNLTPLLGRIVEATDESLEVTGVCSCLTPDYERGEGNGVLRLNIRIANKNEKSGDQIVEECKNLEGKIFKSVESSLWQHGGIEKPMTLLSCQANTIVRE